MTVHELGNPATTSTHSEGTPLGEHGTQPLCAGLIPVHPLLHFADSLDARASDASYTQPPEVCEELLRAATTLRGLIKEHGKSENPHSHHHATWLAHQLTSASARLSNSGDRTYGCTPTLYYHPRRDLRWSARIRVKEPRRRDNEAWAEGQAPEDAMATLLVAATEMVNGTRPIQGGEVTR